MRSLLLQCILFFFVMLAAVLEPNKALKANCAICSRSSQL